MFMEPSTEVLIASDRALPWTSSADPDMEMTGLGLAPPSSWTTLSKAAKAASAAAPWPAGMDRMAKGPGGAARMLKRL